MSQLVNSHLESLISLQKLRTEYSSDSNVLRESKVGSVNKTDPELLAVADQFEAVFLEMLLKQARDSKLSEGLFENKADDNFVQLFDWELAKSSSEKVDIGIAEAIINQMAVHGLKKWAISLE